MSDKNNYQFVSFVQNFFINKKPLTHQINFWFWYRKKNKKINSKEINDLYYYLNILHSKIYWLIYLSFI